MIVGVDFDNTLACYDRLFHSLASERSLLAGIVAPDKRSVRDHLRAAGREQAWTALQAVAYGERIGEAEPFAGARSFFAACAQRGVETFVISHKTQRAYAGGEHDLRDAARRWLEHNGFFDTGGALTPERVYFEATRSQKIARIAALRCTHFVDDLAEFFDELALPRALGRILFEPNPGATTAAPSGCARARSWEEVASLVLGPR